LRLKQRFYIIHNNKGVSLIEILVSILILSLIVGPFLTLFVHATKTDLDTEQMIDATYIAQGCMEEIYNLSAKSSPANFDDTRNELAAQGYSETITGSEYIYTKKVDNLYVKYRIDTGTYMLLTTNFFKVIVEVYYDIGYSELAAKMENVVEW
jgi:prepilin-type N-terminal cleavage/methylation domain-containing protein